MSDRHPEITELARRLGDSRNKARPGIRDLDALRNIVRDCPTFFPGLLEFGRALQRSEDPDGQGKALLDEAGTALENAALASDRNPRALNELAFYRLVVAGDVRSAKGLFEESIGAAARLMEDGAVGLATVLIEEDDLIGASSIVKRGLLMLPESVRLRALLEQIQGGM